LQALAEHAAPTGVKLAVENLTSKTVHRPGATMGEVRELIEGLGEHVGLCFDIGHAVQVGYDPVAELRDAGDKLLSLHLHDVRPDGKDHFLPGEGVIDWREFLAALADVPREVLRCLEISPPADNIEARLQAVAALACRWEQA
jgi:sugar phosphate isomerase/epimerase